MLHDQAATLSEYLVGAKSLTVHSSARDEFRQERSISIALDKSGPQFLEIATRNVKAAATLAY